MKPPVCSAICLSVLTASLLTGVDPSVAQEPITFWEDRATVGGEFRTRGELRSDYYTPDGASALDDEFLLFRSRLFLDITPEDWLRFYVEIQDSRQAGSDLLNRYAVPNGSESDLDLYKAYLELNKPGDLPVSFRLGRQQINYGDKRLISEPNWSNVGRSFDAATVIFDVGELGTIDVFAGIPVIHDWGNFNESDDDNQIYGIYSQWNAVEALDTLELYHLLRNSPDRDDEVHTLGTRIGTQYDSGFDWEVELAGQFGEYRGLDHAAWALHTEVGYRFDHSWQPRLEAGYSVASGDDDPADEDNGTFDNLFPTNHMHYGYMDFISWRNNHNAEMNVTFHPVEPVRVYLAGHAYWLYDTDDNWYNSGGRILRFGQPDAGSFLGTEIDLKITWTVNDHVTVEGGYSHFFAGGFVDDTGDGGDADWAYLTASLRF